MAICGDTVRTATQGLLALRELCGDSPQLPRFRMHWFFKNIEGPLGLYATRMWL